MKLTLFPSDAVIPKKPSRVKFGIDPTGDQLHLGHLIPLKIVKQLKNEGHQIDILFGTFTAQIGDATDRYTSRPILSENETIRNASILLEQVTRIIGNDVNIHYNTTWHNETTLPDLISLMSKFSVQKLLSRDNFTNRMEQNVPITMNELFSPLLQGLDSYFLKTNIEIGGTDQLFNFTISREIQTILGSSPQICIMSPIINGLDGRKMSKSLGNCIFINDTPENVFGKVMSISDATMNEWQSIFMDSVDITKHPMLLKKELAHKITWDIWGEELANEALITFEKNIQNKEIPKNIPEFQLMPILDLIKTITNTSKSEAKRLLTSNAVSINGIKANEDSVVGINDIIKVGKLKYGRIV